MVNQETLFQYVDNQNDQESVPSTEGPIRIPHKSRKDGDFSNVAIVCGECGADMKSMAIGRSTVETLTVDLTEDELAHIQSATKTGEITTAGYKQIEQLNEQSRSVKYRCIDQLYSCRECRGGTVKAKINDSLTEEDADAYTVFNDRSSHMRNPVANSIVYEVNVGEDHVIVDRSKLITSEETEFYPPLADDESLLSNDE